VVHSKHAFLHTVVGAGFDVCDGVLTILSIKILVYEEKGIHGFIAGAEKSVAKVGME
jgi:hypothetical protein